MKISEADRWFSKCVRARAGWRCEKTGKQFKEGDAGLHCSHIFSRRHRTIRWCLDNAQALSFSAHQWFGGNPVDSGAWVERLLGAGHMAILREKRDNGIKVPKSEEKEIARFYREQYKRNQGQQNPVWESYQ